MLIVKKFNEKSNFIFQTSHVNQGDTFDPDFSLMISLLSFPFKELFSGGLPLVSFQVVCDVLLLSILSFVHSLFY